MIKLKSEAEIKILEAGGRRHAEILSELARLVKPGVSTLILEEEALRMIKEGGDKPAFLGYKPRGAKRPFPAALCVSINDEIVHGIPTDRIIKKGDVVSVDLGAVFEGWFTDAAWSVLIGEDADKKRFLSVGEEALWKGIAYAKVGNRIGDISTAIQEVVEGAGCSVVRSLVGHGVGHRL